MILCVFLTKNVHLCIIEKGLKSTLSNTHIHLNIRSQARNMVNSLVEVNWIFMIRRGRIQNRWLSTCGKGKVMYLFIHNMYRKIVVWRLGEGKGGGGAGVIYENIPSLLPPPFPFRFISYLLHSFILYRV